MLGSANNMKEIDPMGLVCHYTAYAITQRLSPTVAVPMCLGVVSCCQMESKKRLGTAQADFRFHGTCSLL